MILHAVLCSPSSTSNDNKLNHYLSLSINKNLSMPIVFSKQMTHQKSLESLQKSLYKNNNNNNNNNNNSIQENWNTTKNIKFRNKGKKSRRQHHRQRRQNLRLSVFQNLPCNYTQRNSTATKIKCRDNDIGKNSRHRRRHLRLSAFHKETIFTTILIVIKVILFVIGVAGNILVVAIIATTKSLHTIQNVFVFNLAVTDLLTLLVYLPLTVYRLIVVRWWSFGEFACDYILPIADIVPSVSILTLVAISVDRYRAITAASTYRNTTNIKFTASVLIAIWFGCYVAVGLPVSFAMKYFPRHKTCLVHFESKRIAKFYFMLRFVLFYLLPSVIIFVCYKRVNRTLAHSMRFLNHSVTAGKSRLTRIKQQKRVMAMFFVIFLTFAVCFLPFNLLIIVYNFFPAAVHKSATMLFYMVNLSSTLAIANSVCNPLILYWLSSAFRARFQHYLPFLTRFAQRRHHHQNRQVSQRTDDLPPESTNTEEAEDQNSQQRKSQTSTTTFRLSPQEKNTECTKDKVNNTSVPLIAGRTINKRSNKTKELLPTRVIWKNR